MPYSLSARQAIIAGALALACANARSQDVYAGNSAAPITLARAERPAFIDSDNPVAPGQGPSAFDGKRVIDPKGDPRVIDYKDDQRASVEINAGDEVSAVPRKFQYGFRLNLRGVYDDNISLTRNNHVSDYYFAIEPGVTIGFGDIVGRDMNYVRIDYAPSIFLFADHSEEDAVQHLVRLEARYHFSRLTIGLSQDLQFLDGTNLNTANAAGTNVAPGVNLDAGGDTALNLYNTNATFTYDLTGKTFLSGGLHFVDTDYQNGLISSQAISGDLFLNYTYSPKLTVGLGATAGYNWVESLSPNQTFEQINLRATYQITGKITLDASAGVEFRQFEESYGAGDNNTPVYEIGAVYQPFDGTSISLRGSRRILNSAVITGNDYSSTNITVGVRQRLLRRIYLGLAAGYEHSDYISTIQFVDSSRRDNYFFVQPAIDVTLTSFWTVGAYYLHRENNSNSGPFNFDDNQFGLRTSFTF